MLVHYQVSLQPGDAVVRARTGGYNFKTSSCSVSETRGEVANSRSVTIFLGFRDGRLCQLDVVESGLRTRT